MTDGRTTISTHLLPVHTSSSPFPLILTASITFSVESHRFQSSEKYYHMPKVLDSSLLTLDSSPQATSCGSAADTAKPILREAPTLKDLSAQLTASLRRPTRRTLTLINKALSYLTPFESPLASVTSLSERRDLLTLLTVHRLILCPYIDVDKIESNLRHSALY